MLKVGSKAIYLPEMLVGEVVGFTLNALEFKVNDNIMYVVQKNLFPLPELTVEECVKHLVKCGFSVTLETK